MDAGGWVLQLFQIGRQSSIVLNRFINGRIRVATSQSQFPGVELIVRDQSKTAPSANDASRDEDDDWLGPIPIAIARNAEGRFDLPIYSLLDLLDSIS